MDATYAPTDIAYPTDPGLLNEAREKLEHIIDVLHEPYKGEQKKPRTYRKRARKAYLSVAKTQSWIPENSESRWQTASIRETGSRLLKSLLPKAPCPF